MEEPPALDDLFGSDDSDNEAKRQEQELEDDVDLPEPRSQQQAAGTRGLFGSDDEDEDEEDRNQGAKGYQGRGGSSDSEDEDRRERREQLTGPPMDIEAPLLPLPPHDSLHLLRTTNIIGVQPKAFDPATYEREDETFVDENGRRRVRLAHNAVIRWRVRHTPDGREVRESNARFVRWEDGSLQLMLGNEVLDVPDQDISHNNYYLFVLRGVIQGQAHLSRKLALRPHTLDSGLHRRLREAVDKRHGKVYKVARHGGLANPEVDKAKREAAEEERIRSRETLQRKQDRVLAKAYGGGRRPSRLTENYLEEDQDWEDGGGAPVGGSTDYDYDDGLTAAQRARLSLARKSRADADDAEAGRRGAGGSKRRRGRGGSDEEEEELEMGDDDEEEAEYEFSDDGDDDEDDDGGARKKARKQSGGGGGGGGSQAAPSQPKARARRGVVLSDDEDD